MSVRLGAYVTYRSDRAGLMRTSCMFHSIDFGEIGLRIELLHIRRSRTHMPSSSDPVSKMSDVSPNSADKTANGFTRSALCSDSRWTQLKTIDPTE